MKLTAAGKVWCIVAALLIDKGLTLFDAPHSIGMYIVLASLIIPNIPDWVQKFRKTESTTQK